MIPLPRRGFISYYAPFPLKSIIKYLEREIRVHTKWHYAIRAKYGNTALGSKIQSNRIRPIILLQTILVKAVLAYFVQLISRNDFNSVTFRIQLDNWKTFVLELSNAVVLVIEIIVFLIDLIIVELCFQSFWLLSQCEMFGFMLLMMINNSYLHY